MCLCRKLGWRGQCPAQVELGIGMLAQRHWQHRPTGPQCRPRDFTVVAVDVVIAVVAVATVAPMVRVARFPAWAAAATPAVKSAFVVMVQVVAALNTAAATVNVTVASFCPVFATAAVNVLVPHPWLMGAVSEARVHVGSSTAVESLLASTLEH